MRYAKTGFFLLAAMLLASAVVGCRRTPNEVQVRHAIAAAAQAAQAGSASDLGAVLSDDFDGNAGELGRRDLMRMVAGLALRGEHVGVAVGPVAVEPRGERFVADFSVTLTSGGRVLPDRLGVYRVQTAWRREGRHWRCYSARWKRSL